MTVEVSRLPKAFSYDHSINTEKNDTKDFEINYKIINKKKHVLPKNNYSFSKNKFLFYLME